MNVLDMEFFIDPSRCIGCQACVHACSECETHKGHSMIHLEFIDREQPDVLCLQEIKAAIDQLPVWLCDVEGYWCYWHGGKGYSGVALLVRKSSYPDQPVFTHPAFDFEHRIVTAGLPHATVASAETRKPRAVTKLSPGAIAGSCSGPSRTRTPGLADASERLAGVDASVPSFVTSRRTIASPPGAIAPFSTSIDETRRIGAGRASAL